MKNKQVLVIERNDNHIDDLRQSVQEFVSPSTTIRVVSTLEAAQEYLKLEKKQSDTIEFIIVDPNIANESEDFSIVNDHSISFLESFSAVYKDRVILYTASSTLIERAKSLGVRMASKTKHIAYLKQQIENLLFKNA
jgi:hypothetical protein